jgi:hypothetical protein
MTLNETVLQKLADWRPPPEGRQTLLIAHEASGWALTVAADRHDDLGSALWELSLQRTKKLPEGSGKTLQSWAEHVAGNVTGLLEPLHVVEVDAQRNEAQLRSKQPTRRSADLYYYEVVLQGTQQATVRRYHAVEQKGRRDQVSFTLTHESVAKLVADLASD